MSMDTLSLIVVIPMAFNIVRALTAGKARPLEVLFSFRKPENCKPYTDFFGVPVRFDPGAVRPEYFQRPSLRAGVAGASPVDFALLHRAAAVTPPSATVYSHRSGARFDLLCCAARSTPRRSPGPSAFIARLFRVTWLRKRLRFSNCSMTSGSGAAQYCSPSPILSSARLLSRSATPISPLSTMRSVAGAVSADGMTRPMATGRCPA